MVTIRALSQKLTVHLTRQFPPRSICAVYRLLAGHCSRQPEKTRIAQVLPFQLTSTTEETPVTPESDREQILRAAGKVHRPEYSGEGARPERNRTASEQWHIIEVGAPPAH